MASQSNISHRVALFAQMRDVTCRAQVVRVRALEHLHLPVGWWCVRGVVVCALDGRVEHVTEPQRSCVGAFPRRFETLSP